MSSRINDNISSRTNEIIFFTIIVNIPIASAETYLRNPEILDQSSLMGLLPVWYQLSAGFLAIYYFVTRNHEDNVTKKESINKRRYNAVRINLFCSSLLLLCLILVNSFPAYFMLIGEYLHNLAYLSMAVNTIVLAILALNLSYLLKKG